MSSASRHRSTQYDGRAVASLLCGVLAPVTFAVPAVSVTLAITAVVTGFKSRQNLRTQADLQGSRLSLLGVALGLTMILYWALKFLIPWILMLASGLRFAAQ